MKILAFAMQKGGVGKTTTLAVGVELAKLGKRVLLVDIDPQSNLTQALGYDPTQITDPIYDVLLNPTAGPGTATIQSSHGVDPVPSTLALAGAELALVGRFGRELLLRTALMEVRRQYDYILIDSPPSLGIFTINALTAADAVIVPLQAHVFALQALPQLEETIEDTADRLLNIHSQAMQNPQFAEAVRTNWIGQSVAALLARPSTPSEVVTEVLNADTPPKVAEVEQKVRQARSKPKPVDGQIPQFAGFAGQIRIV